MPVAAGIVGDVLVRAVLAARDMAAERRGAAALDGAHHLELREADMTCVGHTPCGAMVAEDVRDLQRGTGQDGGVLRRPVPGLPALATAATAVRAEIVERACDRRDHADSHPRVARRGAQLGMAGQRLDRGGDHLHHDPKGQA